jgi:hypothetical protein
LEVRNYGPWRRTWHIKPVSEALAQGLSGSPSFDHKRLDPQKLEQFSMKKKEVTHTYREDTHTVFLLGLFGDPTVSGGSQFDSF